MTQPLRAFAWLLAVPILGGALAGGWSRSSPADALETARSRVNSALAISRTWDGPTSGPRAAAGKTIVFVAADLANPGIAGVLGGVREAASTIHWTLKVIDAAGSEEHRVDALRQAAQIHASGIVLGGFDAATYAPWIDNVSAQGTTVVGWHSAFEPGMVPGTQLFTNVATSAREVALAAASYAVLRAENGDGIVFFTDSDFAIARAKTDDMAVIIRNCAQCSLLAIEDVHLSSAQEDLPPLIRKLKSQYGAHWKFSLAINDLYFDVVAKAGSLPDVANIAAGDGSPAAFNRIRSGVGQLATVAEPLNLQGWQLIDELNRGFAGEEPSGYVPRAHLVVRENADEAGGKQDLYDPDNGYRPAYLKIWRQ